MKATDVLSGLFLLILGCVVAVRAWALDLGTLAHPGAGFFPFWTGVGLAVCAAVVLAAGAAGVRPGPVRWRWPDRSQRIHHLQTGICVAALFVYAELLRWIGFSASTFLLLLVLSRLDPKTSWIGSTTLAGVGTLGFYLVFVRVLSVNFPRGVMGF